MTVSIVAALGKGDVVGKGELVVPSPKADGSKPETTSRLLRSLSIGVELEISARYFSAVCRVHTVESIRSSGLIHGESCPKGNKTYLFVEIVCPLKLCLDLDNLTPQGFDRLFLPL